MHGVMGIAARLCTFVTRIFFQLYMTVWHVYQFGFSFAEYAAFVLLLSHTAKDHVTGLMRVRTLLNYLPGLGGICGDVIIFLS